MSATATGIHFRSYVKESALRHTRSEHVRLGLTVVVLLSLPFLLSPYWLTIANQIAIAVVAAVGLNILVGFTGQISLGQGGFLAVGAYTSALLVTRTGAPVLVGIVAAVVMTAVIGTFFGLPALRLKGLYLAIATLASQFIILYAVRNWRFLTGGTDAIIAPPVAVGGFTFNSEFRWYWVLVVVAALAVLAATNLFRSSVGRAFVAIRDQDIAAEVIGVDVVRYKLLAFGLSSAFVGLAGALIAHQRSVVTWERFTLEVSILYLAIIIVGGLGSVSGAVYGSIFMFVLPAGIQQLGSSLNTTAPFIQQNLPAVQVGAFGLVIILFLIFEPRGLARIWHRMRDYVRLWPFRY
ncbi:branched-chain amino acid ABC transporter permease [soil metagenome]